MEFNHIIWDEDKTNRLYDYKASNSNEENFFGYQVGDAIVHFCSYFCGDLKGKKILDYGSGLGHIINYFLQKEAYTFGVDMSEVEVRKTNEKYNNDPNFGGVKIYDGVRLPYDDNEFDLITCTECIEHILDKHINNVMTELHRVLKPSGVILVTTPNEEDMSKNEICCPECNTIFHKVGHVRSFSTSTLNELLCRYGFKTVLCNSTDFRYIKKYLKCPSLLDLSLRQMKYRVEMLFFVLSDRISGHLFSINGRRFRKYISLNRKPHLFYVGRK